MVRHHAKFSSSSYNAWSAEIAGWGWFDTRETFPWACYHAKFGGSAAISPQGKIVCQKLSINNEFTSINGKNAAVFHKNADK